MLCNFTYACKGRTHKSEKCLHIFIAWAGTENMRRMHRKLPVFLAVLKYLLFCVQFQQNERGHECLAEKQLRFSNGQLSIGLWGFWSPRIWPGTSWPSGSASRCCINTVSYNGVSVLVVDVWGLNLDRCFVFTSSLNWTFHKLNEEKIRGYKIFSAVRRETWLETTIPTGAAEPQLTTDPLVL